MPRYTKKATAALDAYRRLVHQIRDLRPADRRSFERGLVDIGEAVQYEDGPLREEVGVCSMDLTLEHFDGLDFMLTLSRSARGRQEDGPGIEEMVDARQSDREDKRAERLTKRGWVVGARVRRVDDDGNLIDCGTIAGPAFAGLVPVTWDKSGQTRDVARAELTLL